jgi:hypothetical protein
MAIAVVVSSQTFIGIMDRIEHANHHAHFPNPLAGDVEYCGWTAALCADHDHESGDSFPHHHGDVSLVFLTMQSFVLPVHPVTDSRCELEPPMLVSISPREPDHPPKPSFEIRA